MDDETSQDATEDTEPTMAPPPISPTTAPLPPPTQGSRSGYTVALIVGALIALFSAAGGFVLGVTVDEDNSPPPYAGKGPGAPPVPPGLDEDDGPGSGRGGGRGPDEQPTKPDKSNRPDKSGEADETDESDDD